MKNYIAAALALALMITSCTPKRDKNYSWEQDVRYRDSIEFSWTYDRVKEYIQQYIPDVTDEQINYWVENGPLEAKEFGGQLMFFNRTAAGLFRTDPQCRAIKEAKSKQAQEISLTGQVVLNSSEAQTLEMMQSVIKSVKETGSPFALGTTMHCKYTIKVDADAVPEGEIIRCWLPFPRKDVARQQDVKFIAASQEKYKFSDPKCMHSSIYMEQKAVAGQEAEFWVEFEYTSYAEWHELNADLIKPYDKTTKLYKENTAERGFHIVFSERMRNLADSLTAGIENPYDQCAAIFKWIRTQYPWAGARDYSCIENIPEYVLDQKHGDCGQVTLLLMNLLRIKGIPCHWQSGLVTDPSGWNLHDWCEVYFEGIGWVPVDQSAGVKAYGPDHDTQYYYLGGCNQYRMVLNQDYGCDLSPKKIYPRSDIVDYQRGEVEWKGGNVYFPNWHYHMDIEYK